MTKIKELLYILVLIIFSYFLIGCVITKPQIIIEKSIYEINIDEEVLVEFKVENVLDSSTLGYLYHSNDPSIVTFDKGIIKGISPGETYVKISLKSDTNIFKEVLVKVLEPVTHRVTYHLNGGKNSDENIDFFFEHLEQKIFEPVKEGSIFKGWYLDKNFSEDIT